MKKSILFLSMMFAVCFTANAGRDKVISFDRLPDNSREFVKTHFPETSVAIVKMDAELLDTTYEIILSDGSKIEFDKSGNWKEIDCKYGWIPKDALPSPISEFIGKNHKGLYAIEIEKDKRDYDVKLSNGLELKFDLQYNLIGYDH